GAARASSALILDTKSRPSIVALMWHPEYPSLCERRSFLGRSMNNERADHQGKIFLGRSTEPEYLDLKFANRHGLITGATGTGKTVSLQVLAEGFSDAGVPVFAADIKGDLSGIAEAGVLKDHLVKRAKEIGVTNWCNASYPTVFWDLFGEVGHPV